MDNIETKLQRSICVLITANKYKNDISKFSEFILKNKTYFQFIDIDLINKISSGIPVEFSEDKEDNIHIDVIPEFPELNFKKI